MFGALDRGLGGVLAILNAVGTSIILFLVVMTNLEVISRKLADIPGLNDLALAIQRSLYANPDLDYRDAFRFGPIEGVLELSQLSIVVIVFLQLGYATRSGRMVRSDGLTSLLRRRSPLMESVAMLLFNLLGMGFFVAIIVGGYGIFVQHWQYDLWIGTLGLFTVQTWPVKLAVLIGAVAVSLQLFAFVVGHARDIHRLLTTRTG